MTYESQAVDDLIRFSMGGINTASRIMGDFSHRILRLIYYCITDASRTRGREKVRSMIKSEKDLKIISIRDDDLEKFCKSASRMDITYCILKDPKSDGISNVLIYASDSNKVYKIMKRRNLEKVDVMKSYPAKDENIVLNSVPLLPPGSSEEKNLNPTGGRKMENSVSEPTLSQYRDDQFRSLPIKARMDMVNRQAETTLSRLRESPMNLPKKAPVKEENKVQNMTLPLTVAKPREKT